MPDLIAVSAFFLLIHFAVSGTRLRDALTARLGEGPYRGAFAVASLGGLAWMIYAYRQAPSIELWGVLLGFRAAAYVLVFIAFLFAVIGILTPSPTPGIPFAAILAGRNRLGAALAEIGAWRFVAAILLYGAAFYLHGRVGPPLV